jgi:uncharacterized protein YqjF (DUF2071 family)
MSQSWRAQLFAHWPVAPESLSGKVPLPLEIDTFDGRAYLGITPFRLADLRIGPLPQLPFASDFPELNVRTYVRHGGRPGVYFFSLDAASQLAVLGARFTFSLPYFQAEMHTGIDDDGWMRFRSHRVEQPVTEFIARYRPRGTQYHPAPGTLDHFLIERYALFTVAPDGTTMRADIHHRPWTVQPADVDIVKNTMATAQRITIPPSRPIAHYSDRQDALIWAPARA